MKHAMTNNGMESQRRGGFLHNGKPVSDDPARYIQNGPKKGRSMGGGGRKYPGKPGKSNVVKS